MGAAGELWAEQPDHPASKWLEEHGESDYALTWQLLTDVLHAAGGVEYSVHRVLEDLDLAERWFSEGRQRQPDVFRLDPEVPDHMALPPALAWDYPNLLTWLRTLEERIERRGCGAGPKPRLLPPIADRDLRKEVTMLFEAFKDHVGGERELANYALHASRIPQGSPSGRLHEDGTVTMAIPDSSSEPIYIFEQFKYEQGRDLRTFAMEALRCHEEFHRRPARRIPSGERSSTSPARGIEGLSA